MGRESNVFRFASLEHKEIQLLIELISMRSNLTVDASKIFHTKHLQAKEPTEKKLQNSISKYKKLESKKLIEILILLNQRDLALKLAEKHVPEDAITLYAKAGDVDSAIRIYTKNAKSMNAKLAISQVYLNCFDFDKIKTVLTHDILTQVKQNKLGDFLLPYSYTLNDEELLEKLDHWLAENPNNSYIIKKVLSHRYKISAYYLWEYLGQSDNTRLQNYHRLVHKQYSNEELKKLLASTELKVKKNSSMAFSLSLICQKYNRPKNTQKFLKLTYGGDRPQLSEIIRLIKKHQW